MIPIYSSVGYDYNADMDLNVKKKSTHLLIHSVALEM